MEANQDLDVSHDVKPFSDDQFVQQANDTNQVTNSTGTSIEQLNEYCLLEIFSVKSLTMLDLCSIAETCTRFQQITRRVFPKDLDIELDSYCHTYIISSRIHWEFYEEISDAERILKNFGSILTEIVIQSEDKWLNGTDYDSVVQLVAEYCVDSLDSLKILDKNSSLGVEMSKDTIVKLKPIFKRLQVLHLRGVDIVDDETLFADFDSLVELCVVYVDNVKWILRNTFPELERFTCLVCLYRDDDRVALASFISRHPKLKTLRLYSARCFLQTIALKSLKILELSFAKGADLKLLSDLPQLNELHLHKFDKPDDFGQLALLTQLTILNLEGMKGLVASDVVEIIKRLINLEKLSVAVTLNEQTFSRIVRVVKGRSHVLILKCKFDFNWKNCGENQKVKLVRRCASDDWN